LDRWGLLLQGLCTIVILGVRSLFFICLLGLATGTSWSLETLRFAPSAIVLPELAWLNDSAKPLIRLYPE